MSSARTPCVGGARSEPVFWEAERNKRSPPACQHAATKAIPIKEAGNQPMCRLAERMAAEAEAPSEVHRLQTASI